MQIVYVIPEWSDLTNTRAANTELWKKIISIRFTMEIWKWTPPYGSFKNPHE